MKTANNEEYYICKVCHIVRPMYEDSLSCRTCGGPILGPMPKELAEKASGDPDVLKRLQER